MRILLRALTWGGLLLVAAVAAAVAIVPVVVDSDEFRERVGAAVEDALGREVRLGTIGFGPFPPSLVLEDVVVSSDSAETPPLLEAERLELRASLLPLLARTLVVESVALRGGVLHLVRTVDGFELPASESTREGASTPGRDDADDPDAGFRLAVAGFVLEQAVIILEDRSVSPAVTWELREIAARARGSSAERPIELFFELALASGGEMSGSGDVTRAGAVDLEVKLSDVALDHARAYFGSDAMIAGRLSGTITAAGPVANLESLRVDAALSGGRFALDDMKFSGSVKLVADLHGSVAAPRGTFDIDATDAEVRYGGMFTKPPGDAATVRGRLVEDADGSTGIDDVRFKIRNFKGTAPLHGDGSSRDATEALDDSNADGAPEVASEFLGRWRLDRGAGDGRRAEIGEVLEGISGGFGRG